MTEPTTCNIKMECQNLYKMTKNYRNHIAQYINVHSKIPVLMRLVWQLANTKFTENPWHLWSTVSPKFFLENLVWKMSDTNLWTFKAWNLPEFSQNEAQDSSEPSPIPEESDLSWGEPKLKILSSKLRTIIQATWTWLPRDDRLK